MAWQFNASTDQILGPGWSGTDFTIIIVWRIDTDPNTDHTPIYVYSGASGGGSVRAGIGTIGSDGTTMATFDAAFLTQAGGTPGVGNYYITALAADDTSWTTFHGSTPGGLTTVGPNTRTTVSSPGSIVLSLAAEWFRGTIANLKIYNRTLSGSEVAAEAAAYEPISSTGLVRAHSMLTTALAADYGPGAALTAGSTGIDVVAGPTFLTRTGAVAGGVPTPRGALTGGAVITGAAAGVVPGPIGTLLGGVVQTAALAGVVPLPAGALAGAEIRTGAVAGAAPTARGALVAVETRTGAVAGVTPPARGSLFQPLDFELPLRVGAPELAAGWATGPLLLDVPN